MARAVEALRQQVLDPDWSSFNEDRIAPDRGDAVLQGLNQAMTPPFGSGKRFVWLVETTLAQRCSEEMLRELERTLPAIPETTVLLLTSSCKPDGRLKSTKLLQKYAEIREFALIPFWKSELLVKQVQQAAREMQVPLTRGAIDLLTEAVGNNTRQLYGELEKLRLYHGSAAVPLDEGAIAELVTVSSQTSLQLAEAIRRGQVGMALDLVTDLLRQNEPATVIVRSLVTQFRLWLWIKLMLELGERSEQTIAEAADLKNPKRLYFLKKEVESLALPNLLQTLPLLLELEFSLKDGADELLILQTKIIELCTLCQRSLV